MALSRKFFRQLLAQSAVSTSKTGDTNETILATINVPAGAMGPNGRLLIVTHWSFTNSVNNKTLRVRLGGIGGTAHLGVVQTTTASIRDEREISNRNSSSSQVCFPTIAAGGGWSQTTGTVSTSSIDTSASQDIVITAQLASGGETITLEAYRVELVAG